jgi:hypothetical protein
VTEPAQASGLGQGAPAFERLTRVSVSRPSYVKQACSRVGVRF